MIRGLQISMSGEELACRIGERIRTHEAAITVLDARLKQRAGDQPFDVRPEDGFKTVGELENERQHVWDRMQQLRMLRENLVVGERYALSRADLRLAELISPDFTDASLPDITWIPDKNHEAIDGLKLTVPGEEIRRLLEERVADHRRSASWWKREQKRTSEEQTAEEPLLPEHMCENEAERHDWRAHVLAFIREHVDAAEVYRLGEADLEFGELLPEKPASVELNACAPRSA